MVKKLFASKKNKFILVAALITLVCSSTFFIMNKKTGKTPVAEKPLSAAEAIKSIDRSYKNLKIAGDDAQAAEMEDDIMRLLSAWGGFFDEFYEKQPPELGLTRDWDKKMSEIREHIEKTKELLAGNDPENALAEMEKAQKVFQKIKKENNFSDLSDFLLPMYRAGVIIANAATKEEAADSLDDLKLLFAEVKEKKTDNDYRALMAELEQSIHDSDKQLPGPVLEQAHKNIKSIIYRLYMEY